MKTVDDNLNEYVFGFEPNVSVEKESTAKENLMSYVDDIIADLDRLMDNARESIPDEYEDFVVDVCIKLVRWMAK